MAHFIKKISSLILLLLVCTIGFTQVNQFWGVTTEGGASDNGGTIFSTKDDGTTLQTRYSFPIDNPGSVSPDQKIQLSLFNGKLYGITIGGGKFNKGVIFSYDPSTNNYSRLYNFDYSTGAYPASTMILVNGKFYGTCRGGGSTGNTALGVIFEFDPITLVYTKKISFTGTNGAALGDLPIGSMVEVGGKLYGTTYNGGTYGTGVLFEYDPATNIYIVKQNIFLSNGKNPKGNLIVNNNKLYGTCIAGGASDAGTLFEYDLTTNIYAVKNSMVSTSGSSPAAGVAVFNNKLYGINQYGGTNSRGSIFEFDLTTNTYQIVYNYTAADGSNPESELYLYNNIFYGFALVGGSNNFGTIYKFDPATYTYTKTFDCASSNSPSPRAVFFNYNNVLYANTSGNVQINNGSGSIISYNTTNDTYTKQLVLNTYSAMGNKPTAKLLYYNNKIYGSTVFGGTNNGGVLFEFNPTTNVYTKLLDFSLTTTGTNLGPLIVRNGILYGNMQYYQPPVGSNYGAVFTYNPTNNNFTTCPLNIGYTQPKGQLVDNNDGTLTGISTFRPGVSSSAGGVFKYNIGTNTFVNFIQNIPTVNGNFLQDIRFYNSNYYILAQRTNNSDAGTVLEYSSSGSLNTRATLNTGTTGTQPIGFLTPYNGKLYGVTYDGLFGNLSKQGTIFEYNPLSPYTVTTKYEFLQASGQVPTCGLLLYNNKFYGLTQAGGSTGIDQVGVLYEFDPTTNVYTQKVTFNFANGASPNTAALIAAPTGSVVPIKLISFTAKEKTGAAYLTWETAYELNNKGYNIQHSNDGITFENIGFVPSKGNSSNNTNYEFTDFKQSLGKNYYRLQQVDIDGKITYSNIEIVVIKITKNTINIYPNPTSKIINIDTWAKIETVELFDITGKKLKTYLASQTKIDVSEFANGIYILKIHLALGEMVKEKIIIRK